MRQLKGNKWVFILSLLFLFSCSKDNELDNSNQASQENFVGLTQAKEIAKDISFKKQSESKTSKTSSFGIEKKAIQDINEIKNKKGKTVFYIINYVNGGYIILSSDNRMRPIIAFSESGKFMLDESVYSEGLKDWMESSEKQITDIQNSDLKQTEEHKLAWRQVKSIFVNQNLSGKPPTDVCYEHTETTIQGPYLSSAWQQEANFNYQLPYMNCNGYSAQVLAGCVPVAMAQIMKYYNYPSNYNWSLMDPTYATSVTANFIVDIHNAIRTVYPGQPTYSCDATGVSSSADMGVVLKTQFKYSSADWANYNYQVVKDNITAGKPVLLSGSGNKGGHMWVCDGYKSVKYYFNDCSGVSYLYFHMNWGWGPNGANDYFAFDNFNPEVYTFNPNTKMIYNIKP
ncbi:C10 family peptidase [Flavobacterium sp. LHD-80]|uniref:C10 family peptidase n=1 Tax=Flavobacterium sp. LHD-80 TaxID=3071411 RepID=UPI0027E18EA3|nr:C10 family peptidase [Flavobacterium sp. LHD-80]MDQ6472032.1 C10 family peptidase [Flavobacterium sp. LHD-80]